MDLLIGLLLAGAAIGFAVRFMRWVRQGFDEPKHSSRSTSGALPPVSRERVEMARNALMDPEVTARAEALTRVAGAHATVAHMFDGGDMIVRTAAEMEGQYFMPFEASKVFVGKPALGLAAQHRPLDERDAAWAFLALEPLEFDLDGWIRVIDYYNDRPFTVGPEADGMFQRLSQEMAVFARSRGDLELAQTLLSGHRDAYVRMQAPWPPSVAPLDDIEPQAR